MVRKQGKMKRLTSNIEGLSARQLAQRCIGAEELSNGRERRLALGDDILSVFLLLHVMSVGKSIPL